MKGAGHCEGHNHDPVSHPSQAARGFHRSEPGHCSDGEGNVPMKDGPQIKTRSHRQQIYVINDNIFL